MCSPSWHGWHAHTVALLCTLADILISVSMPHRKHTPLRRVQPVLKTLRLFTIPMSAPGSLLHSGQRQPRDGAAASCVLEYAFRRHLGRTICCSMEPTGSVVHKVQGDELYSMYVQYALTHTGLPSWPYSACSQVNASSHVRCCCCCVSRDQRSKPARSPQHETGGESIAQIRSIRVFFVVFCCFFAKG